MTILGIDPGKSGAVAVLDETGQLLAVEDMPSLFEANVRSATNAPLLAGLLVELAPDGALPASLALQSGCPLETLRHALWT